MGVFDLLNPFFYGADAWLAGFLPPVSRLAVWGVAGALVSMGLYWLLSPQNMIVELKACIKYSQRALDEHQGTLREAFPLMRYSLALALKQVAVILVPALVASLPLLFLLGWLYSAYSYRFADPYTASPITTVPARLDARWAAGGVAPEHVIIVTDPTGRRLARIRMTAPIPVVARRQWWNVFFSNPNGYLPAHGPVKSVSVALPAKTYLDFGPSWLRGWEAVFLAELVVVSLLIKFIFRIH